MLAKRFATKHSRVTQLLIQPRLNSNLILEPNQWGPESQILLYPNGYLTQNIEIDRTRTPKIAYGTLVTLK